MVLASAVMDIPEAMVRVARTVQEGTFEGRIFTFDLASGVVGLTLNPALAGRVPETTSAALAEARSRISSGEVELEHFGE